MVSSFTPRNKDYPKGLQGTAPGVFEQVLLPRRKMSCSRRKRREKTHGGHRGRKEGRRLMARVRLDDFLDLFLPLLFSVFPRFSFFSSRSYPRCLDCVPVSYVFVGLISLVVLLLLLFLCFLLRYYCFILHLLSVFYVLFSLFLLPVYYFLS